MTSRPQATGTPGRRLRALAAAALAVALVPACAKHLAPQIPEAGGAGVAKAEAPQPQPPPVVPPKPAPPDQPRTYYYKRLDAQHYVLRSVGADGIPFTNDDIVPNGYGAVRTGLVLERPATTSPASPPSPSPPN